MSVNKPSSNQQLKPFQVLTGLCRKQRPPATFLTPFPAATHPPSPAEAPTQKNHTPSCPMTLPPLLPPLLGAPPTSTLSAPSLLTPRKLHIPREAPTTWPEGPASPDCLVFVGTCPPSRHKLHLCHVCFLPPPSQCRAMRAEGRDLRLNVAGSATPGTGLGTRGGAARAWACTSGTFLAPVPVGSRVTSCGLWVRSRSEACGRWFKASDVTARGSRAASSFCVGASLASASGWSARWPVAPGRRECQIHPE